MTDRQWSSSDRPRPERREPPPARPRPGSSAPPLGSTPSPGASRPIPPRPPRPARVPGGRRFADDERQPTPRVASFGFPLLDTAPRRARRHTVEFAKRWGLDDLVDAAELLVSELMTNALEASSDGLEDDEGRQRTGVSALVAPLELRLVVEHRVEARRLRIEVRDHNPKLPPSMVNDPELSSESGRGLMLIDAYADFWGYHRLPAGGKVVWCVVAPDPPPDRSAP